MPLPLLLPAIQAGAGIVQSILGGSRERKAENAIENLQTPTYNPNSSILNYYNTALQRYNLNPYQSPEYQYGIQQGARGTAAGINALQNSGGSAIGGISRLIALQNNNALQSGITATREQDQRFGQLGQAAGMKSNEERYGFQINKLMPYQKQLDLLTAKAKGGAAIMNAGLNNIFGGAGSGSLFGGNNSTKTKTNGTPQLAPIDFSGAPSWLQGYQEDINAPSSIYDYQSPSEVNS